MIKKILNVISSWVLFVRKKIRRLQGKSYLRTGKCNACGKCCCHIALLVEERPILTQEEFDRIREIYPNYQRFQIIGKNQYGHLLFQCKYLGEDHKCHDYNNRPYICRVYPIEEIFFWGGNLAEGCGFQFIPVEDFQQVLEGIMEKEEVKSETEEIKEIEAEGKGE